MVLSRIAEWSTLKHTNLAFIFNFDCLLNRHFVIFKTQRVLVEIGDIEESSTLVFLSSMAIELERKASATKNSHEEGSRYSSFT